MGNWFTNTSFDNPLVANSTITKDNWKLVTTTYNNGTLIDYVDGQQVASITIGTGPVTFQAPTFIGQDYLDEPFYGKMDDLKIYDRDLSPEAIAAYYNSVVNGTSIGTVASNANSIKIHFGTGNDSDEDYYYVKKNDVMSLINISGLRIQTQANAQSALDRISTAVVNKDKIRADLGATQNRLQNTISNLQIQAENLQSSESKISDTNYSQEMTEFVRSQIISQTAIALLAQANSLPRMALQLMQG